MTLVAAAAMCVVSSVSPAAERRAPSLAAHGRGFVYVMTNAADGNSVIQYLRGRDGLLTQVDQQSTRGLGSGGTLDPLTSQDSLILEVGGHLLIAVNAGSDEVSVLGAGKHGLDFLSKAPSGGDFPNSVARFESLVYVTNRGTGNISGFRLRPSTGALTPIPGSTRALPGGAAAMPGDVRFSPDGDWLVVTETATNTIDLFPIDDDGIAGDPVTHPSAGVAPFGFAFRGRDTLVVTEAMTASVSSYDLGDDGGLDVISPAVPDGQAATCWISLTRHGRIAFVSNTMAHDLSSYRVDGDGNLTLLQAVAGSAGAGSAPIDNALSKDGKYFYVVDSALGRIVIFDVDGSELSPVGAVTGLPTSIQGLAAR